MQNQIKHNRQSGKKSDCLSFCPAPKAFSDGKMMLKASANGQGNFILERIYG